MLVFLTLGNLYLPSGTDSTSKSKREQYLSETVPKLLLNRLDAGCIGGDLNCITDRKDCTHNPASKTSPSLAKMVKTFDMKDSYRELYPNNLVYSHYYHSIQLGEGATRIDIRIVETKYEPIAFSDHMAYVVRLSIPSLSARLFSPRSRPIFKVKSEAILDKIFQERLKDSMSDWKEVKDLGLDVL